MPLTDFAIKKLLTRDKSYRVSDSKGLALLVHTNGSKYWQFRYRFASKGKLLALGVYPETTLAAARERRDDARKQLARDIDPSAVWKIREVSKFSSATNSFKSVGEEWYCLQKPAWSESHISRTWRLLEKNLFPWLGNRPVADISSPELLTVLRRIENRGAHDTAKRVRQTAGQVFRFAISTGRAVRDPSQDLRDALAPSITQHRAAITEPKQVGPLLVTLYGYCGSQVVRAALQLAPLTFVRPGELRKALWSEIDFEAAEWRIAPGRMKMRQPHIVPLSRQAITILRDLYPLIGPYFPALGVRPDR